MISVVMVTYQTGAILFSAIRSILQQPTSIELIVVDNGNPATTVKKLIELANSLPRVKVLTGHGNVGFAAGCNLGVKEARAEYLALINPDCITDYNSFNNFLEDAQNLSGKWLIGADIRNADKTTQQGSRRAILTPWLMTVEALKLYRLAPRHPYFKRFNQHQTKLPNALTEVPAISGAYMMMPRKVYEEIGGMDESYFLHVEDLDFCLRHHLSGGKTYFSPHIKATHHKSSSRVSWLFVEYHKSISLSLYFEKNFDDFYPPIFMLFLKALIFTRLGYTISAFLLSAPFQWLKTRKNRHKLARV